MHIKLFLASSIIEFENYRNEIGALIRRVQDIVIESDIRIHLFVCEYCDSSLSSRDSKQEDYMEELRTSDIFVMLIGKKLGNYTRKEYLESLKCPNIKREIIFLNEKNIDNSVTAFQEEIKNQKDIYTYYKKEKEEAKQIILDSISSKINMNLLYENGKVIIKDR